MSTVSRRRGEASEKRRTRDETRLLLMEAALRVLGRRLEGGVDVADASANPLAGIRITEVLDEVNQQLRSLDPHATLMTTGAAYNIWPSQEEFQLSVLDRIFLDAAKIGFDEVDERVDADIAAGHDWRDLVARCFGADFELSADEPSVLLMLGVTAMGPRRQVIDMNVVPNQLYVEYVSGLLRKILAHAGRRPVKGRSIADLVWAIEAIESGYLLRRRMDPDVPMRRDRAGRTAVESVLIAAVEAFTEPVPPKRR
ncbi:MAG: hypothetical protein FD127_2537 [Acidimicrobiaceae bacterium]|jgi:hypothetical protein|nr:MAG: hypothetical protein FD127_2537 [Acidimicrobiaceae bacterium]